MNAARRDDEGQAVLALIVVVLLVFASGLALLAFGEAADQRGKAQKASDAAALAAGVGARDRLVSTMMSDVGITFASWSAWSGLAAPGCASAPGYAAANSSSSLTSCAYVPSGRVRVSTRSAPSGQRGLVAAADATATITPPPCTSHYTQYTRTITCVGSGGSAYAVFSLESGSLIKASPRRSWQRTFSVRLIA
jgi:hypothetical protein